MCTQPCVYAAEQPCVCVYAHVQVLHGPHMHAQMALLAPLRAAAAAAAASGEPDGCEVVAEVGDSERVVSDRWGG